MKNSLILAEDSPAANEDNNKGAGGSSNDPPPTPSPKPTPALPPAPAPAPPCPEILKEAVRMNLSIAIVLRAGGRNFLQYLTDTPSILQSLPYAYEVVNRTLLPGGTEEQRRCCGLGIRNGRLYLATTVEPSLYTAEFYRDAAVATADAQWSRLENRFLKTTGLFQEQANTAWLALNYDSSITIEKNIELYNRLVITLKESNAGIPAHALTSRLLTSLPSDFAALKQAWSTRDEDEKQFEALIELIRLEAGRRAIEEGVGDVITLVTQFKRMRGLSRRYLSPQRHFQQSTRHQTITRTTFITCWSCGRTGHHANASRSTQRQSQPSQMHQQ